MKVRLDSYLAALGLVESREKAKALIMSGEVFVNGQRADKPGMQTDEGDNVQVRTPVLKYVSRGGYKLEKAIEHFGITLLGSVAADIGASTGGFTDCMLKYGAKRVYAVDVGYGQLAWELRNDNRVVVLERTNARYLSEKSITEKLDFFCVDVSFISLGLILPPALNLLKPEATAVCLIKPQFEAGKDKVGKHGIIRDKATHIDVLNNFMDLARKNECSTLGLTYSPIKGPKGNIEFLAHICKAPTASPIINIKDLVEEAHKSLTNNKPQ